MITIAPSILAADFSRLGEQVAEAESAGAQRIHIDVMDGHFVPNLTMGPAVVQGLRPRTKLPLEVHLMVEDPAKFVPSFIKAGADILIVHHEVLPNAAPLLQAIRGQGKKAGLAINPNTAVEALEPYLPLLDLALCMTVFPGFGGQPFLPESPERIRRLRQLIDQRGSGCDLEVDGGIELHTAATAIEAGANVLVVGTGIFKYPRGAAAAVADLRQVVASVSR
ncbi:MAG TPA: ribulose-phosphate 3-epimerase [Gemmataceae bacterium]|jgi:ribulose-phosphate 3-epimerase|nr:ribulose-phosphate 3-epimerase [Gemmataceae bacterium]